MNPGRGIQREPEALAREFDQHSSLALRAPSYTIALSILSLILLTAPLPAEEPATSSNEPAATQSEPTAAVDAREEERQRRAIAGLLALCGILIGGLALLVLVIIWGARLRRMARRELPAQKTLQNELWFLKPPKSPPE